MTAASIAYADLFAGTRGLFAVAALVVIVAALAWVRANGRRKLSKARRDWQARTDATIWR